MLRSYAKIELVKIDVFIWNNNMFLRRILAIAIIIFTSNCANYAFATDYTETFDCTSGSGDDRDVQTIYLNAGDTVTINQTNCDWAYTSGSISPYTWGTEAALTYTITSDATISIFRAGVYGYQYTYSYSTPLSTTQDISSKTLNAGVAATSFTPVTASGGTAPYTYSISDDSLPSGLSINSSTGAISGTPDSSSSAATYTVLVTDDLNDTSSKTFSLTVNSSLGAIQNIADEILDVGAAASFTPITATGGTTPYTYSISGTSLPSGLSIHSSTGTISGTPASISSRTQYTVSITDDAGYTFTHTFYLTINQQLSTTQAISSITLDAGVAATSFTPVTASGGIAPYTYSISGTSLPSGLSIDSSTGAISGTPDSNSSAATYTVLVTDGINNTSSKTFSLTVNSALTSIRNLTNDTLDVNLTASLTPITGSGGSGVYTYSISPTLPEGLSLNSATGNISGTPTAASSYTQYTVTVNDGTSTTTNTFYLTVNSSLSTTLAISSKTIDVGTPTSFTPITATGGTYDYSYAISPSLPSGLTLDTASGLISGTATLSGAATNYTVTVTDAEGATSSQTFTLIINEALLVLVQTGDVLLGQSTYSTITPVIASGGTGSYTYSISPSLPGGLSFNTSSGQISGTPSQLTDSTYMVTVTDSSGATSSQTFNLIVGQDLSTNLASSAITFVVGTYSTSKPITADLGVAPYTFTISPSLPDGLSLSSTTGEISGVATIASQATNYTITVTDSATIPASFSNSFTLTVNINPTADATLSTQATSHITTIQHFAQGQINNIGTHIQQLHNNFTDETSTNNLNLSLSQESKASYEADKAQYNEERDCRLFNICHSTLNVNQLNLSNLTISKFKPNIRGLWIEGGVNYGSMRSNSEKNKFTTTGITVGMDKRMHEKLIVGATLGLSWNKNKLDSYGSQVKSRSPSASIYASFKATKKFFLDAAIGYGRAFMKNTRWSSNDSLLVGGNRLSSNYFGTLMATLALGNNEFKFAPYIQADFSRSWLHGYKESGNSVNLLTYKAMKAKSSSLGGGVTTSYDIYHINGGILTPFVKLKFMKTHNSSQMQGVYFTNIPDNIYYNGINSLPKNITSGQFGLTYKTADQAMFEAMFGYAKGSSSYISRTFAVRVRVPF
jgi:hypothetical protein